MKIYLAASFARQAEMREKRAALEKIGHSVTSRWIDESTVDDGIAAAKNNATNCYHALNDIADIRDADCMIAFTESPASKYSRGGRHVETGVFIGLMLTEAFDRRLFVVGPTENIFHALPQVEHFHFWIEALTELEKWRPRKSRLAAVDAIAAEVFACDEVE